MVIKKQVTISQVAQEAGVSTQTVSRVLNNRPDVAPETRQLIQEIIDRLGYQPSILARGLKQRNRTLGVVAAELWQYGPMRRMLGIEQGATNQGYSLHLSLVHEFVEIDKGKQLLQELLAWRVEGIIWAVPEVGDNRTWLQDKIPELPVPILFISERPDSQTAAISVDNRMGGCLATEHLLAQGYQHIGIITGPSEWHVAQQRLLGWQDTLPANQQKQIIEGDWAAISGKRGLHQLLAQYPELEAIFACNDQMALGVLQAAHQLGLRIPEDLGLVGFDNTPESAYFWPPLTTVRHQLMEQGILAVNALTRMIEAQHETGKFVQPEAVHLQPELIVRESSLLS
jgi:LacI family transcriptional regulator